MISPLSLCPVAITDVHYLHSGARAAVVVAASWTDAMPIEEHVVWIESVAEYRSGSFFERELPCVRLALRAVSKTLRCVVVDGYVELDAETRPGLGAHLHDALGGGVAVIGVAKSPFHGGAFAAPVVRGGSHAPLYVTARGVSAAEAARRVHEMHGAFRIPTLLRRVDQLARGLVQPTSA